MPTAKGQPIATDPTPMSALRSLVGRIGPYCFVLGLLTVAYFQFAPSGDSRWIVPALLAVGLWLLFRGLRDRANRKTPDSKATDAKSTTVPATDAKADGRPYTLPLAVLTLTAAAALAYWSTR